MSWLSLTDAHCGVEPTSGESRATTDNCSLPESRHILACRSFPLNLASPLNRTAGLTLHAPVHPARGRRAFDARAENPEDGSAASPFHAVPHSHRHARFRCESHHRPAILL